MTRKPNYQPWFVSDKEFPVHGGIEDKVKFITKYGVLAPSTHNTQPWQIIVKGNQMAINPDYSKRLTAADPNDIGLFISIGAFTENIVQASNTLGLNTDVEINDNRIVIKFAEASRNKDGSNVLKNILNRSSNKFIYQRGNAQQYQVYKDKLLSFQNTYIRIIQDKPLRDEITKIHLGAAQQVMGNQKFVHEVSGWLRSNSTRRFDGMPGFVMGHSTIKTTTAKLFTSIIKKMPSSILRYEKKLLDSAPFFVIFGSKSQRAADVIETGMLIERFWLAITEEGLVAQPLFAMINSEKHKLKLKKSVGMNSLPVFFLRVGEPTAYAEHTPRRPL